MKQLLYTFNKETLKYDRVIASLKYTITDIIFIILVLIAGFILGYYSGTKKNKQDNVIKVIHSDSLSVYYPIEYINSDSIKGNTKVANDLRYYYNQILKRK